jgi:hypothetical protein
MFVRLGALLLLICCGLLSGCAATSRQTAAIDAQPSGMSKVKQAAFKETLATEKNSLAKTAEPSETASTKTSTPATPEKSGREKADTAETTAAVTADELFVPSAERGAKKQGAADVTVSQTTRKLGFGFNQETLKQIDAELQDASSEERQFWFEQLKQVDVALVPEILRARRMSIKLAEKSASSIQTVSHETEATPFGHSSLPGAKSATKAGAKKAATAATVETDATSWEIDLNETAIATDEAHSEMAEVMPQPAKASAVQVERGDLYAASRKRTKSAAEPGNKAAQDNPPMAFERIEAIPERITQQLAQPEPSNPIELQGFEPTPASPKPVRDPNAPALLDGLIAEDDPATELNKTITRLESSIARLKPGETETARLDYLKQHVELRMMYLLAGRQERALTAIPNVEPAHQEFWQQMLWGMANYFDQQHIPAATDRASQTVVQLDMAVKRLSEKATLEVRNVNFCQQIDYYGNYVKFGKDEFRPGQEVLVYAEVDRFTSEPTPDGQYRTRLRSTIDLLSPSGENRQHIEFTATEDLSRTVRRDYFHNYQFTIPDRLPLGPHTLKLTIFDELGNKMASYSVNFLVK